MSGTPTEPEPVPANEQKSMAEETGAAGGEAGSGVRTGAGGDVESSALPESRGDDPSGQAGAAQAGG